MANLQLPSGLLRRDGAPLYLIGVEAPSGAERDAVIAASRHGLSLVRASGPAQTLRPAAHEADLRGVKLLVRLPDDEGAARSLIQALARHRSIAWELGPGSALEWPMVREMEREVQPQPHPGFGPSGAEVKLFRGDPAEAPMPEARGRWALLVEDGGPSGPGQPSPSAPQPDLVARAWSAFFHQLHVCAPWPHDAEWERLETLASLVGSVGWWRMEPMPIQSGDALGLASATELMIWLRQGTEVALDLTRWPGGMPTTWLDPYSTSRASGHVLSGPHQTLITPLEPGPLGLVLHLGIPRPVARHSR